MKTSLFDKEDLKKATKLKVGGEGIANLLMFLLRLNKVNKFYSEIADKQGLDFLNASLDILQVKFEINPEELKRIPKTGPFITISNHPFGGIDGIISIKIVAELRPDYKNLGNYLLQRIPQLKEYILPVDPFEGKSNRAASVVGLKKAMTHLKEGGSFGVFPAGEVSTYYDKEESGAVDRQWQDSMIRFIKKAEVPVIPIYFQGTNSRLFHLLGLIHPMLRTAILPWEMLNKKNKTIKVRIGSPITVQEQQEYTDISRLSRFLRLKTYALGSSIEVKNYFNYSIKPQVKQEPLIDAVPQEIIEKEVETLMVNNLLFKSRNYSVVCAPSIEMPNIMTELGRLREETFRDVGEGTNSSIDIDEFDLYYWQLFIWDEDEKRIVGAYRAGKGKEIISRYGINGFYIRSLFKIDKDFTNILEQSIELGRSFIVKDYQRKPMPLFLLWKGILYFLIKNPEYRYLIGPVSISNRFSAYSKSLIISFMKSNYYDHELAKYITPKNMFRVPFKKEDYDIIFNNSDDISRLDNFIKDIEPEEFRMPVLLKKYVKLNGKIICFNVDPKFNDALDGLLILDLFNVPIDTITSLSKEINDKSLLDRFNLSDYTFEKE
ncbi:MAG: lysophospholipid acyltransferase family protein [Tenuifilaceae bacterium]